MNKKKNEDRERGGKTISRSGQNWIWNLSVVEDRVGWRCIVETSSVVPQRPTRFKGLKMKIT